ncbi:hypothetical protein GCM10022261_02600 [Brevibacterium daeguense]|uniref:TRAP-type C4-dicarboxylate transport system, substrate-binding protein n=1 Tax=Brevibacterium daeguense TaxID=909936 RepID=A0ABP8EFH0_9MICO|nr:TRAP transporter substrate-binding protein DctP [Brevibacterium daeguense]
MKKSALILAGSIAALSLSACAGGVSTGETADTVKLSFSNMTSQDSPVSQAAIAMFEAVDEEYEGNLEVEYFWSSALVPGDQVLDALGSGMVDIAMAPTAYYPSELPVATWGEQLSILTPAAPGFHAPVSSSALSELFRQQVILDEYAEHGAEPLVVASTGAYSLQCKEPIEGIEDAKGTLVRAASPAHIREAEAVGLTPVSMSNDESYEGLQRGAIDCTVGVLTGARDLGHFEQVEYITPTSFSAAAQVIVMNQGLTEELPPELVELFRTTGSRAFLEHYAKVGVEEEAEILTTGEAGKDANVSIEASDEINDALDELHRTMLAEHADKAPESVQDAETIVAAYRELHERHASAFENNTPASREIPPTDQEYRDAYVQIAEDIEGIEAYFDEVGDSMFSQ